MTKRNKAVLIALPLLVLAGIALLASCSDQGSFSGSRVKNPDAYLLDIEKMNGTDLHTPVSYTHLTLPTMTLV